jgi:hypothetical protein
MPGLALVAALALWASPLEPPPPETVEAPATVEAAPRHERPPSHWLNGSGAMTTGGVIQALSLAGGITGISLRGAPGMALTVWSTVPLAAGGGLVITGAWLRGRHQGWNDPRDLLARVRTTRRAGWSLMGLGLGLVVGSAVALLVLPSPYCAADEGCGARYPWPRIVVESGLLLGSLMASSGSGALLWGLSYSEARSRRVELTPTLGGLSLRF